MQRIAIDARRDMVQLTILILTNPTGYTVVHSELVHVSMLVAFFDRPGQLQVELLWLLCRQHSIRLLLCSQNKRLITMRMQVAQGRNRSMACP